MARLSGTAGADDDAALVEALEDLAHALRTDASECSNPGRRDLAREAVPAREEAHQRGEDPTLLAAEPRSRERLEERVRHAGEGAVQNEARSALCLHAGLAR